MDKMDEIIILGAGLAALVGVGAIALSMTDKAAKGFGEGVATGLKDLIPKMPQLPNVNVQLPNITMPSFDLGGMFGNMSWGGVIPNQVNQGKDEILAWLEQRFGGGGGKGGGSTPLQNVNAPNESMSSMQARLEALMKGGIGTILPAIPQSGPTTTSQGGQGVYNQSIGKVINIDQMMPEDRQTIRKSEAQQLADYGAIDYRAIVPQAAQEAPWFTRVVNGGVEVWDGSQGLPLGPGWDKTTRAEAIRRVGGR